MSRPNRTGEDSPLIDVHVRGIDPGVWRELRLQALKDGISMAKLIEGLWANTRMVLLNPEVVLPGVRRPA